MEALEALPVITDEAFAWVMRSITDGEVLLDGYALALLFDDSDGYEHIEGIVDPALDILLLAESVLS